MPVPVMSQYESVEACLGAREKYYKDQRDKLVSELYTAISQIEYMHSKFKETGSGNGLIYQWQRLLAEIEADR